jgi:PPM family protein phosphatase
MKFSVYQVSRKGGRPLNEDRLGYSYTRDAVLLVLADGLGGHPEGEKAAEIAVRLFSERFLDAARPALPDVPGFLAQTLTEANRAILDHALAQGLEDNPRTTIVAVVVQDGRFQGIHSGDSRWYWLRDGHMLQRTRDHTYHEQARFGQAMPAHANRNILFTCLGTPGAPLYDLSVPALLQDGDRLLLCSDGLWGVMPDEVIAAGGLQGTVQSAAVALADRALRLGGPHGDNVSVLMFEWDTPDDFPTTQRIQTEGLGDSGFASTIQLVPGDDDPDPEDFDEAAIERSIAEINEAIRRTAAKRNRG